MEDRAALEAALIAVAPYVEYREMVGYGVVDWRLRCLEFKWLAKLLNESIGEEGVIGYGPGFLIIYQTYC